MIEISFSIHIITYLHALKYNTSNLVSTLTDKTVTFIIINVNISIFVRAPYI